MVFANLARSAAMSEYRDRLADAMGYKDPAAVPPAACAELARVIGVSRQAVEKLLKHDGSKTLATPNNSKAARHLGVDTDWLATGETRPGLSHQAIELGLLLDSFPEAERGTLKEQCKGVLKLRRAEPAPTPPSNGPKPKRPRSRAK
jgi:hypothetical protein